VCDEQTTPLSFETNYYDFDYCIKGWRVACAGDDCDLQVDADDKKTAEAMWNEQTTEKKK
jgi:hypothetical protein